MVLDRLFLWIFTMASLFGTFSILCEAPSLYDYTSPIDIEYSIIAQKLFNLTIKDPRLQNQNQQQPSY